MATVNLMNATSMVEKLLCSTQLSTTSITTVYTVPASSGLKLASGILCNTSVSSVTLSVYIVPSGGTAGATNKIIHSYSLAAADSLSLGDIINGLMLGEGDFIAVECSASNALNVVLSGAVAS